LVDELRGSDLLPKYAAALIERGDQLPRPLADFVVTFLREPNKWLKRRPGRKARDLAGRDINIGAAVLYIVGRWGFSATRNREPKTKRACGASIVKEALANAAGVHLGEEDVIRAWNRFRRGLNGGGGITMTVGNGQLLVGNMRSSSSEKLETD
jgi:hypothetical protein